ncbi:MAG: ABC transporter permease [Prevotellaceae bacterium]|jgi:putative ABC transport system permease protein|nr:ABC transporter permease [Prevotellaceae bacterium]
MNIFNTYKRTRFFLWTNITGLAIGLAASILLILFVVNEWSYDKHFANRERIVRLLTVTEQDGDRHYTAINLRNAVTELPDKAPGIETSVQVYTAGRVELTVGEKRFRDLNAVLADAGFFKVFQTKFIEGTPDGCLAAPNACVVTRQWAEAMFGSPEEAMNKTAAFAGMEFAISGVVEAFPKNSHLWFDIVAPIVAIPWLDKARGLEFLTYYLIRESASLDDTRRAIEDEYRNLIKPWSEHVGTDAYGETEMLDEVYLRSPAKGRTNSGSMPFIWILTGLALFILTLAVTNFINLFVTQGQLRMNEIGIRKAAGARIGDIVRQFFSEVTLIVLVAFLCGLALAVAGAPHFAKLIGKDIDLIQLTNPLFIGAAVGLFAATVVLSAFYPALYLSRFSPLEILGRRVKFSKRRLTAATVVFQSALSIVLLSVIVTLYEQTSYLERLPLGYNPDNLMIVVGNRSILKSYEAVKQELLKQPEVKDAGGSHHVFGGGWSGQVIAKWEAQDNPHAVNEYRLMTGMPELMELELVEGRFWRETDPDSIQLPILNEAAVKMLGGESPLEKTYNYHGRQTRVSGVVRDFYYDNPTLRIEPIVLTRVFSPEAFNIRFHEGVGRLRAHETALAVFRQFDPEFVLNPTWSEDIYASKFNGIKTIIQLTFIGSLVAIFVAMLGLLAIHLFTVMRRTKEIGIRRIHGAGHRRLLVLFSLDVLKWIGYAAVIALPAAAWIVSRMLEAYANRVSPDWMVFVLPIAAQCLIALLTTSGVTLNALRRNPAETVKSD